MKVKTKSDQKTIWIINQYASHLMTRHEELSKSFAEQGYKVAVITTSFHHGKREYMYDGPIVFRSFCDRVTYVYLHSSPSYRNNGIGRFINMLDFCRLVSKYKSRIVDAIGVPAFVIASSAPPFVWDAGYKIAKKFNAKFIAEFRDIWPMSLVDIQGVEPSHPLVKYLSFVEKRAYKRADAIVSTMPYGWKHVIEVAHVPKEKVYWMANGINVGETEKSIVDGSPLPEDLAVFLKSHWCGVYIGSIVKSECLDYILKSISYIEDPDIYFAIIGDGHEKSRITELAKELKLDNVKFFDAIDKSLIPKALSESKMCIAAHDDFPIFHYGLSMNKLNDYLASGIPTVFICNVDSIVKEAGHFAIPMTSEIEAARTIERIKELEPAEIERLSKQAKELIKSGYDYPEIGRRYLQMMEQL